MTRHLRWILPVLAAPVLFIGASAAATAIRAHAGSSPSLASSLGYLGLLALAWLGSGAAVVVAIVQGRKAHTRWRHSRGRFNPAEQARIDEARAFADGLAQAKHIKESLLAQQTPPQISPWDLVAHEGEVFFADGLADYARFYGTTVGYAHLNGSYEGSPAFVAAALALTALSNSQARASAVASAAAQWRELQRCRVVVSNQRILCLANGRWLSFHHSAATAVYPEAAAWSLVMQYENSEPLLIRGPLAPAAGVLAVMVTQGSEALRNHPRLREL